MWDMDWAVIGSIASLGSAVVTALGIVFLVWQIHSARQTAAADFVLRLEREFSSYVDTYQKLRPQGSWGPHQEGPSDEADLIKLVSYLNFFVSLQVIIRRGFLDLDTLDQMFAYRFFIAVHNPHTIARVIGPDAAYWGQVLSLYRDWMALRRQKGKQTPQEEHAAGMAALLAAEDQGVRDALRTLPGGTASWMGGSLP